MTVDLVTFKLKHVFTDQTFYIIDKSNYGGLEVHYGCGDHQSPFSVVLDANTDDLLDSTSPNGWIFQGGDEVKFLLETPDDTEGPGTIYDGMILDVEPIVSQKKGRLLRLSGVNFGDFWGYGSVFEKNYKDKPQEASKVLTEAIASIHPDITVPVVEDLQLLIGQSAGSDPLIRMIFEAAYSGRALYEICSALGLEYSFVAGLNIPKYFRLTPILDPPVNSTLIITEADVIGTARFKWTDDGYHFDEVYVHTAQKMYAPNTTTPTGAVFCGDKKFWEARQLLEDDQTPTDVILPNFVHDGPVISGCLAGMAFGWNAPSDPGSKNKVALTMRGGTLQNDDGTKLAESMLGLIENHWDVMELGIINNFSLQRFQIRLNHGKNGSGGYWISNNLANIDALAKGPLQKLKMNMPTRDEAGAEWTRVGSPTLVDEVQFIVKGNFAADLALFPDPTIISYLHFYRTPRSRSVSTESKPRVLIRIDRRLGSQSDIDILRTAEQNRVRDSALVGTIMVDGSLLYAGSTSGNANRMLLVPGDGVVLNIPHYGLFNTIARVDHIVHQAVNGRWLATIAFGPFAHEDPFDLYHSLNELLGEVDEEGGDQVS